MNGSKRLIVNADDFGFTHDVNRGIVDSHRNGILTATTLMANGDAFEDAIRLAEANPDLDIGCHLALVQGRAVRKGGGLLPASPRALLTTLAMRKLPVYDEIRAQTEKILEAGIRPTHLDTHKHTHLLPPVLAAVARLSQEYGIPWVRRPFDIPKLPAAAPVAKQLTSRALRVTHGYSTRLLQQHGCRATDHFLGFQVTGRFRTAELADLLSRLPEGLTEFMCHPGYCTDELRGAATRLKESRDREREALMAEETRQALDRSGVRLTRYRDE